MTKRPIKIGLAVFFLIMVSLAVYLFSTRKEPLYKTHQERRRAQEYKKLQENIGRDIKESVDLHIK